MTFYVFFFLQEKKKLQQKKALENSTTTLRKIGTSIGYYLNQGYRKVFPTRD